MIDEWAGQNPQVKVIAQSNEVVKYSNFTTKSLLPPNEYKNFVSSSDVIIGHAGIGTIITAHEYNLPLIVMPRKYELGEHRNDHQVATAEKFKDLEGIYVVTTKDELYAVLGRGNLPPCKSKDLPNRERLIKNIKSLIHL